MNSPPFNADFYVVAATVIPVLVLPLIFPGGLLAKYAVWVSQWRHEHFRQAMAKETTVKDSNVSWARRLWDTFVLAEGNYFLPLPVLLTLLAGSVGEISAIIALDRRHATSTEHTFVLISMYVLPVIASASAIVAVSQAWVASWASKDGPDASANKSDKADEDDRPAAT